MEEICMKQANKKLLCGVAVLAAATMLPLSSCGDPNSPPPSGGNADRAVTITTTDNLVTMENGNISLSVTSENGNISDVTYLGKDVKLVGGEGANFSLTVDPTTKDVFQANHNGAAAVVLQSKNFTPEVKTEKIGDNGKITLTYDLSFTYQDTLVSGIKVVNTLSLNRKDMYFTSDYTIKNDAQSDCVVVNFTGMQISGIKDVAGQDAWSFFYPYKEGKLYSGIVKRINDGTGVGTKMTAAYPSPMSMQLMQLYNGTASFDYSVLDSEGIYKEFNFGKYIGRGEYDEGRAVGDQISMSCTQFPFVKNGDNAVLSSYRVGAGGEGSWYEGSDRYREFLIASGMTKEKNGLTAEWTGMNSLIAQGNTGSVFATYENSPLGSTSYAQWMAQSDPYGIDTLCAIGWNEGGFDHNYPDYAFSEAQGGEESFGRMVEELNTNGDAIICYINAHIADEASTFATQASISNSGQTKLQAGAIKKVGFKSGETALEDYERYMYHETYGTLSAYAMSPASEDFQEAVLDAVQRLADKGVNGIWFDQLMEMPAYLDYDASHGANNPATAYSEGYRELLTECVRIMEEANNGDCIFVCEGVCDAYIKWIDCCGMMWQRKLGSTDTTNMQDRVQWTSQITRYTMPCMMLGLEGVGTTSGSSNEFARAFVLGEPLLVSNYQDSVTRIMNIYSSAKKIYFEGRYLDMRGLRCGNEDVIASLIQGSDGTYGLQLYNDNTRDAVTDMKVVIDPEAIGAKGKKVESVINLMTGERVSLSGENTFTVSLDTTAIGAYQIIFS